MSKFYITTTLPYVNALPHAGHTLEFIQADVIARYMRTQKGSENVIFNIGTDEHGQKMYEKALEVGKTPQEFVDENVDGWKEFCELYNISYSNFYRTSDKKHKELAQKLWQILVEKKQIYKKNYKGLYCVGCESFKLDKELVDGICPDHGKAPIEMEEENYFLRLSEHSDKILKYIERTPEFVKSPEKLKHLVNFLKEGLKDISVSRIKEKLPWGIAIPNDPDQVMYVWLDALSNYIFAAGYLQDDEKFNEFWPGVQLCGPDNLKFQGAIWQGILSALDLPFSKQILVHGMVNAEDGRKMSKTLQNTISPFEILDRYGLEAVRYYFILGIPTFSDVAFSHRRVVEMYNDGLADKYGNLLNRVIHLANKEELKLFEDVTYDEEFKSKIDFHVENYHKFMSEFELSKAMEEIFTLSMEGNEYITVKEPWSKDKNREEIKIVLQTLGYLLKEVIRGYSPILVNTSKRAMDALINQEKIILFEKIPVTILK